MPIPGNNSSTRDWKDTWMKVGRIDSHPCTTIGSLQPKTISVFSLGPDNLQLEGSARRPANLLTMGEDDNDESRGRNQPVIGCQNISQPPTAQMALVAPNVDAQNEDESNNILTTSNDNKSQTPKIGESDDNSNSLSLVDDDDFPTEQQD